MIRSRGFCVNFAELFVFLVGGGYVRCILRILFCASARASSFKLEELFERAAFMRKLLHMGHK